jgi:hypothetical protein
MSTQVICKMPYVQNLHVNIYSSWIINVPNWMQQNSPLTEECINKVIHLIKGNVKYYY